MPLDVVVPIDVVGLPNVEELLAVGDDKVVLDPEVGVREELDVEG